MEHSKRSHNQKPQNRKFKPRQKNLLLLRNNLREQLRSRLKMSQQLLILTNRKIRKYQVILKKQTKTNLKKSLNKMKIIGIEETRVA